MQACAACARWAAMRGPRKSGKPDLRGPSAKSAKRVTGAGCDSSCRSWVPGLAALARDTGVRDPGARSDRWPQSLLTISNSAVFFVPAPRLCVGVRPFCSHPSPNEGVAERRQAHSSLLCRACEARRPRERNAGRPVATGTPSRRSVVAVFGRGPVLPPPAVAPEPMSTCPRQTLRPDGRGPGPPALRFAPQSRDATPHSIVRIVSGDAPSERGCEMCSINSFRSQEISAYRSWKKYRPLELRAPAGALSQQGQAC
jgi:hypothetical protein